MKTTIILVLTVIAVAAFAFHRQGRLTEMKEVLGGTAPFAWREYLVSHRDLPDWQNLFEAATRQCMRADSKRTLELIEQELARGNPEVATTNMRQSLLLALATSDPDKMLARAVSPELAADPDALAHLGGFGDDKPKKPACFKGALNPDSQVDVRSPQQAAFPKGGSRLPQSMFACKATQGATASRSGVTSRSKMKPFSL
jgi:hypothetical protein